MKNFLIALFIVIAGGTAYVLFMNTGDPAQTPQVPENIFQPGVNVMPTPSPAPTTPTPSPAPTTPTPAPAPTAPMPSPVPTPTQAPEKTYTAAEVAQHGTGASCWTIIRGDVYDLTEWITKHPGGSSAILKLCGKDGTQAFVEQHGGSERQEDTLVGFKIGVLVE